MGNCGGLEFITTLAECNAAAEELGLSDTQATYWDTPYGCYLRNKDNKLYFNLEGNREYGGSLGRSICLRKGELLCNQPMLDNDNAN